MKFVNNINGPNESKLNLRYINRNLDELKIISKFGIFYKMNNNSMFGVNRNGVIFSIIKNKIIKPTINKNGYHSIKVSIRNQDGDLKKVTMLLHRIILNTFRPIENFFKYQVNHIDGDKLNNRIENLEWVINGQNSQHGKMLKRITNNNLNEDPSIAVGVSIRNIFTGEYKEFNTILECADYLNISKDSVLSKLSPNKLNEIWLDGWQFKRRQDIRTWDPITEGDFIKISNGVSKPLLVLDLDTGVVEEYSTIADSARNLNIGIATIWNKLQYSLEYKRLKPFYCTETDKIYLFKYKYSLIHGWVEYPTRWHALMDSNISINPIILINHSTKDEIILPNLKSASDFLNLGKTTILYRLSKNKDTPWGDGFIYSYFIDWYTKNNY